jgi:hypothetical protein
LGPPPHTRITATIMKMTDGDVNNYGFKWAAACAY